MYCRNNESLPPHQNVYEPNHKISDSTHNRMTQRISTGEGISLQQHYSNGRHNTGPEFLSRQHHLAPPFTYEYRTHNANTYAPHPHGHNMNIVDNYHAHTHSHAHPSSYVQVSSASGGGLQQQRGAPYAAMYDSTAMAQDVHHHEVGFLTNQSNQGENIHSIYHRGVMVPSQSHQYSTQSYALNYNHHASDGATYKVNNANRTQFLRQPPHSNGDYIGHGGDFDGKSLRESYKYRDDGFGDNAGEEFLYGKFDVSDTVGTGNETVTNSSSDGIWKSQLDQFLNSDMHDMYEAKTTPSNIVRSGPSHKKKSIIERVRGCSKSAWRKQRKPGLTASKNTRLFTNHTNYVDFSKEEPLAHEIETIGKFCMNPEVRVPFPYKLHKALSMIQAHGLSHIIGWLPVRYFFIN